MIRFLGASEDRVALTRAWEDETRLRAGKEMAVIRREHDHQERAAQRMAEAERDRKQAEARAALQRWEIDQAQKNRVLEAERREAVRQKRHAEDLRQEALGCYFCEMCKRYIPVAILERHVASCATYFQGS